MKVDYIVPSVVPGVPGIILVFYGCVEENIRAITFRMLVSSCVCVLWILRNENTRAKKGFMIQGEIC